MDKLTAPENLTREDDKPGRKGDRLRAWRLEKVWEYKSMGCTVEEIVDILKTKPEVKISHGTVINDLRLRQEEVEKNFSHYIENLQMLYNLAMTGLDRVIKEGWRMYAKTEDPKVLAIISDAMMKKQAVLGDPAQIEKAIKTVASLRSKIRNEDQDASEDEGSSEQLEKLVSAKESDG